MGAAIVRRFFVERCGRRDDGALPTASGALSTYNKGLANEVGPKGVRVNMISPGFIETEGAHGMIVQLAHSSGTTEDAARQQIMKMIGGIPIGRPGVPEEVAELVASTRTPV